MFTNDQGGILDDFIATKTKEDYLFLVSNASRRQNDMEIMLEAQVRLRLALHGVTVKRLKICEQIAG